MRIILGGTRNYDKNENPRRGDCMYRDGHDTRLGWDISW